MRCVIQHVIHASRSSILWFIKFHGPYGTITNKRTKPGMQTSIEHTHSWSFIVHQIVISFGCSKHGFESVRQTNHVTRRILLYSNYREIYHASRTELQRSRDDGILRDKLKPNRFTRRNGTHECGLRHWKRATRRVEMNRMTSGIVSHNKRMQPCPRCHWRMSECVMQPLFSRNPLDWSATDASYKLLFFIYFLHSHVTCGCDKSIKPNKFQLFYQSLITEMAYSSLASCLVRSAVPTLNWFWIILWLRCDAMNGKRSNGHCGDSYGCPLSALRRYRFS